MEGLEKLTPGRLSVGETVTEGEDILGINVSTSKKEELWDKNKAGHKGWPSTLFRSS